MTLVKIGDDVWTKATIKSTFDILVPVRDDEFDGPGQSIISGGSTIVCGLGWRFSCSATYGLLSFSIDTQHLLVPKDANHYRTLTLPYQRPNGIQIGTYIYTPGLRMVPTIAITVGLPAESGLSIPRSIDGRLERVLADTMSGKAAVDVKFYAFTRKTSAGYVTHPQPIFAKSTLLKGYSGELDLKMEDNASDGWRAILSDVAEALFVPRELEASHVPLPPSLPSRPASSVGLWDASEASFVGRASLSDVSEPLFVPRELKASQVPLPPPLPPLPSRPASPAGLSDASGASFVGRQASEVPLSPSRRASSAGRMGRVVILRGTAFKTWQALLYYLYTSKLSLSSAPQLVESQCRTPQCSAKSMYRLADKLGLDALKAFSLFSIKANLSIENIIRQVFSKFTSRYSEVQDIEVEFVLNNFPALSGEIDQVLDELCKGDRPYCADVLRKIVAGRNPSSQGKRT
ncbi:hypothetical protein C8F04DRAFT_1367018 [Mycena alexandri]|uniref:Uncharacterized protein n=1 Tax=Mycena alexandri TaxID=1745969 RepID=A0AAD6SMU8_9AGAR|nr:hypothetical protein C8F04DRAFT_1367018 [Mycena alexandri]